MELTVEVKFEEHGGNTTVNLRQVGIPGEMPEACEAGWNESLDKLAESLK